MATLTSPTATSAAEPETLRRTAFIAGVLYLVTIVASIPVQFILYEPVFSNPEYVLSARADSGVLWGGLFEMITALACIGTAVVLFPVVKRQNEAAALGFVTARVFEAGLIVLGIVSMLSVVALRQPAATEQEAVALVTTQQSLVAVHDWTFLLGPGVMPGINALLLGFLMYRSGLVPRIIPLMGLIGAPLILAAGAATLLGFNDQVSVWTGIATAPIFAWELSLGVWLTAKGFKPTPITSHKAARTRDPM